MLYLSLNQILAHNPCEDSWENALAAHGSKGMDTLIPLTDFLESNGVLDVLWSLRCFKELEGPIRLLAVGIARKVQHLNPDPRVGVALDTAEKFARSEATAEELGAASAAASAAVREADKQVTKDAARAAFRAADWEAASATSSSAASATAWATARGAVWGTAWATAWATARDKFLEQEVKHLLIQFLEENRG